MGRNLAARLKRERQRVYKLDVFGEDIDIKVDITDFKLLKEKIKRIHPQIVVHLAACVDSKRDYETSKKTISTNILGTLNLLEVFKDLKNIRFVFMSTEEVYGMHNWLFHEENKLEPRTPYAISKAAAEYYVQMYHRLYRLPIVLLRFAAIFGPAQNPTKLIPYCILQVLKGEDITLYSAKEKRDFIFIDDAVEAIYKACFSPGVNNEIINFGNKKIYLLKDIAKQIVDYIGKPVKILNKRNILLTNEARYVVSDFTKAQKVLHWKPSISLEEGLKRTIEWYSHNYPIGKK